MDSWPSCSHTPSWKCLVGLPAARSICKMSLIDLSREMLFLRLVFMRCLGFYTVGFSAKAKSCLRSINVCSGSQLNGLVYLRFLRADLKLR